MQSKNPLIQQTLLAVIVAGALFSAAAAPAATLYWDTNGATAGFGATGTGTWGSSNFWSTSAAGTAATGGWTANSDAVFDGAFGDFTVTVSGTQSANSITLGANSTGRILLTGGNLNLTGSALVDLKTQFGNISSILVGSAGLTKAGGPGRALFIANNSNSYTGITTVRSGQLFTPVANGFGASATAIRVGDGSTAAGDYPTVGINAAGVTLSRNITLGSAANSAAYTGIIAYRGVSGTGTFSGNITFDTAAANYIPALGAQTGGTALFTGGFTTNNKPVEIGGNDLFTSGGVVQINSSLVTTGGVTVNSSNTLRVGAANAVGNSTTPLVVNGTFDLNNFNDTIGSLAGSGTVTLGSGTLTVSNASSTSFSGAISGAGGLTKVGAGSTLTLSGANNYTGNVTITAGTIKMSGGTLYSATVTNSTVTVNGTLDLNGTSQTIGLLTGSGTVDNTSASPVLLTVYNNTNGNSTFNGAVTQSGGGKVSLQKFAVGTLTLGGVNTFSGELRIGNGDVTLNNAGALNGAPVVAFTLNANSKTLTLNGNNATIAGLDAATLGSGAAFVRNNLAATTATLTLNVSGSNAYTFAGGLNNGSGGTLALFKTGTGVQTLTQGGSNYSGGTSILGGTLAVNNSSGSATGTGGVTIGAAGNLAGNGYISGLVTTAANTSKISPGASPGTLSLLGGLNAAAGATFYFELGAASDLIDLGAAVFTGSTAANGLRFHFADSGGFATGVSYTLLTFGSSSGLDYTDLVALSLPAGVSLDENFGVGGWLIDGNSLSVQMQLTVVPEPSTALLITVGAAALAVGVARRRRKPA